MATLSPFLLVSATALFLGQICDCHDARLENNEFSDTDNQQQTAFQGNMTISWPQEPGSLTKRDDNGPCCTKPRPALNSNWVNDFTSSPKYTDGNGNTKQYLFHIDPTKQKGDWFQNYDLCKSYGLDMVAIRSQRENDIFHTWARAAGVGMKFPGGWLGAQIFFLNQLFHWNDYYGGERTFNYFKPSEPNQLSVTCLSVGWENTNNFWWDYVCTDKTFWNFCQLY